MPDRWVRLTLSWDWIREGRVVSEEGVSMVVRWLGSSSDSVVPWAGEYRAQGKLVDIETPQVVLETPEVASTARWVTIDRAARYLGLDKKEVRQLIRAGKLVGVKNGARWQGVVSTSVIAYRKRRRARATG